MTTITLEKAQNDVTFAYLAQIPERERIRERMTKLWDYEKYGAPSKHGKSYVYAYNTGLQNQSVVYLTEKLEEKGRVLFDPNAKQTIHAHTLHSHCDYTLLEGRTLHGRVEKVFLRGQLIVDGPQWLGQEGMGRFVPRGPVQAF